ncbi:fungal-specific transcription factor domain-containing protein [Astrocystis sublimbata]|nr:fungal-specific transcription factor domain-containing protein [Astrocystis sublimbata]
MEEEQRSSASAEQTSTSTPAKAQKHEAASASDATGLTAPSSKRRRGLGIVTPNACTECRKKRAKCDGEKPCGRCRAQKDVECHYEVPVRQSKENLRHEIETLRKQQQESNSVFSALVRPESWEEVLRRLQRGQPIETISEWLGSALRAGSGNDTGSGRGGLPSYARPVESASGVAIAVSLPSAFGAGPTATGYGTDAINHATSSHPSALKRDFDSNSPWNLSTQSQSQSQSMSQASTHPEDMPWGLEMPPRSRVGSWLLDQDQTENNAQYRGVDQVLAPVMYPDAKVPASTWTNITNDSALVQHLLALYFCWEYPTFASLSKEHFLVDYAQGRHRYCSPILVNALLALGCRFSSQPNTRAIANEPKTSGDHFFKEALRLLYREVNHHNLTTIQALGIMSIREASCGRDSESWYYAGQSVRLAIEMGLHRLDDDGDQDELAVQAATFWGAFALDHAWSLATGSLPQCSSTPHLPPKPAIVDSIEASLWVSYTDDAPLQRSCEQPSNVRSVYKCFCELSELVHQSLYILHSPGRPLTSRDLLTVLFAHMYYHFAILLLFRPLIRLRIIGSSLLPLDVCSQAADAIQGLLRSYSQLYTLRRTPSFVPYFLLTSSIMHLTVGASGLAGTSPAPESSTSTARPHENYGQGASSPRTGSGAEGTSSPPSATTTRLSPKVTASIKQSIADLAEMAPCHHFAEQALNILRFLGKKWNINADLAPQTRDKIENLVRPSTNSLNFFVPNVSAGDFTAHWSRRKRESSSSPSSMHNAAGRMEGVITEEQEDPESRANQEGIADQEGVYDMVENPLFWPFPQQGQPILPEGRLLEEAGFAPL